MPEWIERGTHRNQEIAQHFGVSIHTVYTWKARLKRNGGLGLTRLRVASCTLGSFIKRCIS